MNVPILFTAFCDTIKSLHGIDPDQQKMKISLQDLEDPTNTLLPIASQAELDMAISMLSDVGIMYVKVVLPKGAKMSHSKCMDVPSTVKPQPAQTRAASEEMVEDSKYS